MFIIAKSSSERLHAHQISGVVPSSPTFPVLKIPDKKVPKSL